jgi:hypothetical protein
MNEITGKPVDVSLQIALIRDSAFAINGFAHMKKPAARSSYALAVASLMSALAAQGQILFQDNFNTTPATAWTINAASARDRAVFLFDYSTMGIPSAPNSGGSTIGVMLQANRPVGTGALSGVSISPNDQSFSGDYQLRFDLWQNFPGAPTTATTPGLSVGGTGSTQLTGGGILTAGNVAHFAGAGDGLWFVSSGDGGTTSDYRAYFKGANQTTTSIYAAGGQNNTATYYNVFGGESAPQAQLDLYPQQVGTTQVGAQGMSWRDVVITKIGNSITYDIDGVRIATVDLTTAGTYTGSNILLAQSDINATQTTTGEDPLLFGLVDNVRVTQVPEPSTYALMGLGAMALLAHARRAAKR